MVHFEAIYFHCFPGKFSVHFMVILINCLSQWNDTIVLCLLYDLWIRKFIEYGNYYFCSAWKIYFSIKTSDNVKMFSLWYFRLMLQWKRHHDFAPKLQFSRDLIKLKAFRNLKMTKMAAFKKPNWKKEFFYGEVLI